MEVLKAVKSIPRNIQCPECGNIYKLNIDQRHYIGQEVVCRCNNYFFAQPIDVPKNQRRSTKKFNLVSVNELEDAIERAALPGGIINAEFLGILHEPKVVSEIINAIKGKLGVEVDKDDVVELIKNSEWLSK